MTNQPMYARYPSLRDRSVLISGGASGIGAALVKAFVEQGARVVFLDLQPEVAAALIASLELPMAGTAPLFHACDLTDIDALQKTMQSVLQQTGGIDVLVNNAGNDTRHSIEEVTSATWDQTIAVNLKQQFFLAQSVIPGMRAKRRGSILNMSSIGWMIPSTNVPVYVTAKAGIVGMTRTLAHELGPDGIRVNAVLPGAIVTDRQRRLWLTPEYEAEVLASQALKRLLVPEDVARLVLFLASDDSDAITNQSYVVDGGWV